MLLIIHSCSLEQSTEYEKYSKNTNLYYFQPKFGNIVNIVESIVYFVRNILSSNTDVMVMLDYI